MRQLVLGELAMVSGGLPNEVTIGENTYKVSVGTTTPGGGTGVAISISGSFGDLGSWLSGFGDAMVAIGGQIADAVSSAFNTVADFISAAWDYVTDWFSGFASP
jgi:hypothetical protein